MDEPDFVQVRAGDAFHNHLSSDEQRDERREWLKDLFDAAGSDDPILSEQKLVECVARGVVMP